MPGDRVAWQVGDSARNVQRDAGKIDAVDRRRLAVDGRLCRVVPEAKFIDELAEDPRVAENAVLRNGRYPRLTSLNAFGRHVRAFIAKVSDV